MTPDQFRRIEQLYEQALNLPPDQRKAFLDDACPNETERERVIAMIEAHERDSGFLSVPAILVATQVSANPASRAGERISHYKILRRLGKGGMGEVYLAEDTKLDRHVALKFISTDIPSNDERKRLIREAKAAAAINHPNVVAIHEIGEGRGVTFIVMEYVEGKTVADKLLEGPFEVPGIVDIGIQVASALDAAQAKGIVHRDIKPRNLIITRRGQIKVLDFGLAKFIRPELHLHGDLMQTTGTSPGQMLGTLPYMSPEQLMGRNPDHRSDLFSLGVVLYQLATGRVPFHGMLLEPIDQTFDRPIDSMGMQPGLHEIVSKCLQKEPEHRYSSAGDLLVDLKSLHEQVVRGAFGGLQKRKRSRSLPYVLQWTLLGASLLAGAAFAVTSLWKPDTEEPRRAGQVFVRSTSEGGQMRRIALNHGAAHLAVSPNGDKLFVSDDRRELSIIKMADYSVKTVALPRNGGPLAVSPTGQLYIGSSRESYLLVFDVNDERLRDKPIPVGAPVVDMAFNLEGDRLYLAQSNAGLKRLSIGTNDLKQITDRVCPEGLEADAQGMRLYVAYQCSGPSGSPGHDVVEIYDLKTETLLDTVGGPAIPMVGQKPRIAPDGRLVMLDGADACGLPAYDHVGCKRVGSHVYHLLDATTRRIIRSLEYEGNEATSLAFLDSSRFLLSGDTLSVVDANTGQFVERLTVGPEGLRPVVVSRDRKRAFFGSVRKQFVLVFELDDSECSPKPEGLALFYPGDGTFTEVVGQWGMTPHGKIQFVPGRVGQAFFLDGNSFMSTDWTGRYQFGVHDFSVTAYVRFARTDGEMDLFNWTAENPFRGMRLLKSADGSFVVQSGPNAGPLKSTTIAKPGVWYHVAVTRMEREIALYVNGVLENSGPPPEGRYPALDRPLFFGGRDGKPTFQGWLDEMTFYNRSLTQQEVQDQYLSREQGPCRL